MPGFYCFGTDFEATGINNNPMKLSLITFFFLIVSNFVSGQSDQEAIRILDGFSAKAVNAPSVSMKFNLITVNEMENTSDTIQGFVILKGDKYRLELPDNIIFFDSENIWTYLPAEKEVTITKADKEDESFQNKPSSIFSIYKTGYKNRLIEEKPVSSLIDLYPEDVDSDVIRVRLMIGKPALNLISLEYKRRDGIKVTLYFSEYDLRQKPGNEVFVFRKENHKDVEVIDMR